MKNKMCQKNVTATTTTTTTTTTDATIIPAWTQLIVTLCYNNLVSNNQPVVVGCAVFNFKSFQRHSALKLIKG
jgi:hypothetical protein